MKAFSLMDVDQSGSINAVDIARLYDIKAHPDLISGQKTENEIYREFLDSFDVGGQIDGKVTEHEWIEYYTNLSATIDDDDGPSLMVMIYRWWRYVATHLLPPHHGQSSGSIFTP